MKNLLLLFLFLVVSMTAFAQIPLLLPIYEGEDTIVFYNEAFEKVFQVENQVIVSGGPQVDSIACKTKKGKSYGAIYDANGQLLFQENRSSLSLTVFRNGYYRLWYKSGEGNDIVWTLQEDYFYTNTTTAIAPADTTTLINYQENRLTGCINTKGDTIIPAQYTWINPFQFGLSPVHIPKRYHQAIINKKNDILYENRGYSTLTPLSETIIYEDFRERKHRNQYINIKTGAVLKSKDMMRTISDLGDISLYLANEISTVNIQKRPSSKRILTTFPTAIRPLYHLRKLDVQGHQITEIPAWITDFKQLKELNLKHNPITTLPKNIGDLRALQIINLSYTPIQKLPKSFYQLPNLKTIHITEYDNKKSRKTIAKLRKIFPEVDLQVSHSLEDMEEVPSEELEGN